MSESGIRAGWLPWRTPGFLLLALACALLPGCNAGLIAVAVILGLDDDDDGAVVTGRGDSNSPPLVVISGGRFIEDPDVRRGQSIEFTLLDEESDPVDVVIQWAAPGAAFPDLPAGLAEDPVARENFLDDDELRRIHQVATLHPEIIEGRVEDPGESDILEDGSMILATWILRSEELRGLRGLAAPLEGAVSPGSLAGRDVELVQPGATPQRRRVCSYDPATGVLTVHVPFAPPAAGGDLVRIDLGGSLLLESSPGRVGGVVHRRAWASDVDRPGGGALQLRITPYDRVREAPEVAAQLCLEPTDIPLSSPGLEGVSDFTDRKDVRGPFGVREPLVELLAPTSTVGAVAAADVDGDGRLDIVAVEGGTKTIVFMLQTAPGQFDVLRFLDERLGEPRDVAVSDLDGDGDQDVVVVTRAPSRVALFFQEGDLDFIANRQFIRDDSVFSEPSAVVAADLDGDGDVDLAIADGSGSTDAITIFYRGDAPAGATCGAVQAGYTPCSFGGAQAARDIALARVDDDGPADLITAHTDGLTVFYAGGDGIFDQRIVQAITGFDLDSVTVADVNGDSTPDLVGVGRVDAGLIAAEQVTPESFEATFPAGIDPTLFITPTIIEAADLDGNGRMDLVIADGGGPLFSGSLVACLADSSGVFSCDLVETSRNTGIVDAVPSGLEVADLDGDGLYDLISGEEGSEERAVVVQLQDRVGNFSVAAEILAEEPDVERSRALAAGDLDGDGLPDLVTVNPNRGDLTLLLQRDGGSVEPRRISIPPLVDARGALRVVTADIDGDGRVDLATANFDSDNIALLFKDEEGQFTRALEVTREGLRGPESLALADLDGDGRLDVVTAGRLSGDVVWSAQDETGNFMTATVLQAPAAGITLAAPLSVVASDINADGLVDVLVAGHLSRNLVIFYQANPGVFEPGAQVLLDEGVAPVEVVVADLDGDVLPDLAVAGLGSPALTILLQTAPRVFAAAPQPIGLDGVVATALAAADLNGDGRTDLVLADAQKVDPALLVYLAAEGAPLGGGSLLFLRSDSMVGPTGLVAFDFDGDGEADIMSANRAGSNVSVFRGGR